MEDLEKTLVVVGAAGTGAGAFGLPLLAWLLTQPTAPGLSGAAAGALALLIFGGVSLLGAVAGVVAAIRWLRTHEYRPWKPRVWVGLSLGLLCGLTLHAIGKLDADPPDAASPWGWLASFAGVVGDLLPHDMVGALSLWPVGLEVGVVLGTVGGVLAHLMGRPSDPRQASGAPLPADGDGNPA